MNYYQGILFWLSAFCVIYTYMVYPLAIAAVARLRPRPIQMSPCPRPSISIIVAAYNEATNIARRLDALTATIADWGAPAEIIVVSDGSTDATAAIAAGYADYGVRLLEQPTNQGKAAALNLGAKCALHEVLILSDARQSWSHQAIEALVQNFADPQVGAVGGELILRNPDGVLAGVGLYWRFEKWLRRLESQVHSTIGLSGAICAVRHSLFPIIPQGTILDDVYWPLAVTLHGHRTVFEPQAQAFDCLPDRAADEFRRKVRTLSGNFQLIQRLPSALLPWKNPIWIQFYSHKLMRLVVPWAMLATLLLSCVLDGAIYRVAFWGQASLIALAVPSVLGLRLGRTKACSAAASFLLLNAAAWCAAWVWASGCATRVWHKPRYA